MCGIFGVVVEEFFFDSTLSGSGEFSSLRRFIGG